MSTSREQFPQLARPTYADAGEIDAFVQMLGRFERREIDSEQWRAYRVLRGAYSQRQDGVHMLRIKLPQGQVDADQLLALAEVAERYSRGFGHITTRQNFQVHFVRPADLDAALRRLSGAGITTSGAGGNAVRNVVSCPLAGISADEVFDVTPYADAVTRHFLRHPLATSLPRKFKIAFEGCARDHVATAIQDLGFRARVRVEGGVPHRGFSVTAAGGTSSLCTAGPLLYDFLSAGDVLTVAEAVVRVFHAHGDRANKQRNRLKFLVRALGFDAFRTLVNAELGRLRELGAPALPFDPQRPSEALPPDVCARPPPPPAASLAASVTGAPLRGPGETPEITGELAPSTRDVGDFLSTNVRPQRQPGFSAVRLVLPQGDISSGQLEALAQLAASYGEGSVRFTSGGNVLLRWVPTEQVPELFVRLAAAGLGRNGAGSAADVVACPGADACRLAITRTRGVARRVDAEIRKLGFPTLAATLPVHVSGCPNGCSQHHLAAIGLQGSVRRHGDRAVPQYFVLVGGGAAEGARFGRLAGKVPASRVATAVARLASLYVTERIPGESAGDFFTRELERAKSVLGDLEVLTSGEARAEDFLEPGSSEEFRPETQQGECAA